MRTWFFLSLLILTGCGTGVRKLGWPAQVSTMEGFSDEHKTLITSFIDELNGKMSKPVLVADVDHSQENIIIKKVDSLDGKSIAQLSQVDLCQLNSIQGRGVAGATVAGRATVGFSTCVIEISAFVADLPERDLLKPVLWHEIGHCAGLDHETAAGRLMSPMTLSFSAYNEDELSHFFSLISKAIGF